MSTYTIIGDTVEFENPYHKGDIVLKHEHNELKLIFNSEVIFKQTATHQTIKMGNYEIIQNNSGNLEFKKDGKTKFIIE